MKPLATLAVILMLLLCFQTWKYENLKAKPTYDFYLNLSINHHFHNKTVDIYSDDNKLIGYCPVDSLPQLLMDLTIPLPKPEYLHK